MMELEEMKEFEDANRAFDLVKVVAEYKVGGQLQSSLNLVSSTHSVLTTHICCSCFYERVLTHAAGIMYVLPRFPMLIPS